MADIFDNATDLEEKQREASIGRVRAAARMCTKSVGVCLYCDEPVGGNLLFCDISCRDDYAKEQRLLSINGRNF